MSESGRQSYLTFVSVAIGQFAGFALALIAAVSARDAAGNTGWVGIVVTPLPAAVAAGAWAVVNRWETGRKWLAALAVFLGAFASLVIGLQFGLIGLVGAMAAAGGFGVAARRLLDSPGGAL
jgi:hypothetical protein